MFNVGMSELKGNKELTILKDDIRFKQIIGCANAIEGCLDFLYCNDVMEINSFKFKYDKGKDLLLEINLSFDGMIRNVKVLGINTDTWSFTNTEIDTTGEYWDALMFFVKEFMKGVEEYDVFRSYVVSRVEKSFVVWELADNGTVHLSVY